ncbi:unnamed protein product [Prunus armeniaca]|uniref:Uncharacterized protein n=1 Tax=Prunus armeniaca TaxID=36596 RepID=A0A6J5WIZ5_PRUAR|nr:unnamed protein product [Prunus armeniaca]
MESREQRHPVYPTGFAVGRASNKVSKWAQIERTKKKKKRLTQGFISSMPWHTIFAFLNPLLINILQVKCQGSTKSPFDTHRRVMWIFLLATLVYCFAFAANMKSRGNCSTVYSRISGHFALLSGSLSSKVDLSSVPKALQIDFEGNPLISSLHLSWILRKKVDGAATIAGVALALAFFDEVGGNISANKLCACKMV